MNQPLDDTRYVRPPSLPHTINITLSHHHSLQHHPSQHHPSYHHALTHYPSHHHPQTTTPTHITPTHITPLIIPLTPSPHPSTITPSNHHPSTITPSHTTLHYPSYHHLLNISHPFLSRNYKIGSLHILKFYCTHTY